MARTRDLDAQQQRLSEATWSVLTERGLAGLTIRAVAERAGCTTGLVMHAFPTKESLLLHARDQLHARTAASADGAEAAAGPAGPEGALLSVLHNALALDASSDDEARVWVAFLSAALADPALAARHVEQNRRFVERITRLVGACRPEWPAGRARTEALGLVALTEGLSSLSTADRETYSPAAQRQAVTDAVSRALGAPGSREGAPGRAAGASGATSGEASGAGEGGMRIRPFEVGETDAVVALWEAAGLLRPWNDPRKDIVRKLSVQPELFLVAELDPAEVWAAAGAGEAASGAAPRVVGTAMVGYDGHRGWVNYLAVEPRLQGRGVGRALMAEAERALAERGCPKLNLQLREGNTAAAAFYDALGYHRDAATSFGKRLIPDA